MMSFDDSSKWASRIIDDLIEEKEMLEKNSKDPDVMNDIQERNQKLEEKNSFSKLENNYAKAGGDIKIACNYESFAKRTDGNVFQVSSPDQMKSPKLLAVQDSKDDFGHKHPDDIGRELHSYLLQALELEKSTSCDLKRIDEKVNRLGFTFPRKEKAKNFEKKSIFNDLNSYYEYFKEQYLKEEIASRREENIHSYEPDYYVKDILQKLDSEDEEDVEEASTKREFSQEVDDSFRIETTQKNCEENTSDQRRPMRDISNERKKLTLYTSTSSMRGNKDAIEEKPYSCQQMADVIIMYRNACNIAEELVVKPIASFAVGMIDFIIFIFFLSAYVLYMVYKNMTFENFDKFQRRNLSRLTTALRNKTEEWRNKHRRIMYCSKISNIDLNKKLIKAKKITLSVNVNVNDTLKNETIIDVKQKENAQNIKKLNTKVIYQKGSDFLVRLNKVTHKAVVKSHNEALVDIIMVDERNSTLDESNKKNRDNTAMSFKDKSAEKYHNKCTLNKASSIKSNDSKGKIRTSCSMKKQRASSGDDIVSNNSSLTDYSTISNKRFIFNSTAIEDLDTLDKAPSIKSSDSKRKMRTSCSIRNQRASSGDDIISNNASLTDYSTTSNNGFILNSTAIEDLEPLIEYKNRSHNSKILSPPETYMSRAVWDNCLHSIFSPRKSDEFSSLAVNLPSFRSRSEIRLGLSFEEQENAVNHNHSVKAFKYDKQSKKPKTKNGYKRKHSVNLKKPSEMLENIAVITPCSSQGFSYDSNQDELFSAKPNEKSLLESSKDSYGDFPAERVFSDPDLRIRNADDGDSHPFKKHSKNSFGFDNPEYFSRLSIANRSMSNDRDSLMVCKEAEASDKRESSGKRGGSLRRRMSLVLNNWRKTNIIQCVRMSSKKTRKTHK